ncbi:T9SS type B sorting domain-containing protein [Polaribacter glomeratus]|uniref:Ig-like domain-containing protein n=1 Tax=Polaribacter glomeratus TaxID=102 RepID=A0A2S7WXC7_9FLAO|nr:T9SS type B sorting domain-containing protein [Polaribacter glomeratus]PQJ82207.1 hypothetical protein BTO16_06295 [Polaribacter glomeratus]TXD66801.1 T9SS type B sorting domain-containing protein [Polaribacter glomeratus]
MKKLFPFLLLIFTLNVFSQKEANFWYFGENAGIDFSTSPPTALTNGKLNTTEGCSSFSSPTGELLFYSDGIEVFNKDHALMTYSDGRLANDLKGNPSSTQSGMIIPKPGSTSVYYLFTVGTDFVPRGVNPNPGFNYYTIDFSANPLGEITAGPVNLAINPITKSDLGDVWSEKVTAVKGSNCDEVWVLSFVQNTFYAYRVNAAGVDVAGVVTSVVDFTASDKRGYLQVSPNGAKIAFADYNAVGSDMEGSLILFDFDASSGIVKQNSSQVLIPRGSGQSPYGVAFSQQSNKLYTSTFNDNFTVFQFDLESPNIASSRAEIITKRGFRGALQLGPDGKIYASIPESSFLDVIENPNNPANDIIYTEDAIDLITGRTVQGLPPFLASLLLPIEIKDEDTNSVVNNENLQYCIGQDKTITPATIAGTNVNYTWIFNNGTTSTTLSSSSTQRKLELTNISLNNAGIYALVITLEDDCGNNVEYNATFNIDVFEAASAKEKPENIIFCDTDRDGFNAFDLQTNKNTEILNGLDTAVFKVSYFLNVNDANSNINSLSNPYTNTTKFSSQTIFARVENRNAPKACFAITNFNLAITDFPEPKQPIPYRICDDLESGFDTDGKINTFLLNTKDSEILGDLDPNQYNITYHTTKIGAENNDVSTVIDKSNNLSVTNSKQVFIRVENKDNIACYDANKILDLFVDPLPVLKNNPELEQCISANDSNPSVNLTTAQKSISETVNATFKYYEDAAATAQITNVTSYPVQVNTTQSVFVIVTSDKNCDREIIELKIKVGQTPDNDYNDIQPPACDDFLDADGNDTVNNSDTDNITNFYLDKDAIITSINPPANTNVFFYENADDRNNTLNEIDITNYRNNSNKIDITTISGGIQFPIYYKILSTINNNCQGLGEFYLQINTTPTATNVNGLELCDDANDGDGKNGIVQTFNLESQTSTILGTQSNSNFTVSYHLSAVDANSGNSPQASLFTNTIRDLQTIFVRVTNNSTGCFTDHTTFNLTVNPLPIANFVDDLEVCDDNTDGSARNGFSQTIDLESQTSGILGTQDATINKVTYHRNLTEAQNGVNPLGSPFSNTTANRQTIYVRVFNADTQCANGISNFDVVVNPEPTFETISNLSECDNNDDFDDANGIIQTIDLDGKIPEILGASQDPDDFIVTFHASKANATLGTAAISTPYENSTSKETIFVRIQNKKTSCINDDAFFDVIVNSLPDFMVTTPQIICLNNLPLNIRVENPRGIYTYEWKNTNGTTLNTVSTDNINITTGGIYTVTATTTNGTFCSRTETIDVNESNIATLERSFITIIDESSNIGSENNLSISINTIDNDLGPGDYQFAIVNTDDNSRTPFAGFQNEPLFENLEGGIYKIIVNDKNGCSPDTTLLVSVIQFPKFFTPNADGDNDTWIVKGANKTFYPNSSINIFNRYGKLVAQLPIDGQGWDGTYGGKTLSSDDYWFNITLIPADITKPTINKKGNFSLIRK